MTKNKGPSITMEGYLVQEVRLKVRIFLSFTTLSTEAGRSLCSFSSSFLKLFGQNLHLQQVGLPLQFHSFRVPLKDVIDGPDRGRLKRILKIQGLG